MKRKSVVKIEVEGRGVFPVDMLRYDQCAPAGPDDVSKIEHSDAEQVTRRTVNLNCYAQAGPTPARWSSFGWVCREVL